VAEEKDRVEVEEADEGQEVAGQEVEPAVVSAEVEQVTVANQAEREEVEAGPAERTEASELGLELAEVEGLEQRGDLYYYGTGRRKTASAQVRLYPSKEPTVVVNDKPLEEYFSRRRDVLLVKSPLRATATEDMFLISVKVQGGGVTGQAGAVRHGIARALTKANPELRRMLRKEGSLTRDPRMKERKKPGLKRARKAPQYTKR
jgi:small subunit ribosomal protein S9